MNMNKRGFTLIELLVVISIIGLLSSIVLSSVQTARAKARDARRISDMRQIKNALELYFSDNGTYPLTNSNYCPHWSCQTEDESPSVILSFPLDYSDPDSVDFENGVYSYSWNELAAALSSPKKYISLPRDPLNDDSHFYRYAVSANGKNIDLSAILEKPNAFDCSHANTNDSRFKNTVPADTSTGVWDTNFYTVGNDFCKDTPSWRYNMGFPNETYVIH